MKALEEKIVKDGQVFPGNILKVSSFLNQQIDTSFLKEMGKEIAKLYEGSGVNKILTVEASGIAIALSAAFLMDVPVVFAKKGISKNMTDEKYSAEVRSFTKGTVNTISVDREFLSDRDKILIVDDFLADGNALKGLLSIAKAANAEVAGAAIAIEKGFQGGGDELRKMGIRIESLAILDEMTKDRVKFRPQN